MDFALFQTLGFLGLAIVVALIARRLRLPYTVGLVLAGAALAALRIEPGLTLTHDLIYELILPPLLFEAALNLRWRELARDAAPVLALAIFGVAMSAAVVAFSLELVLGWPLAAALVFGALIAATDPIAVIALLRETRVSGRLRLLIEAESLLNDGVAAVLFAIVLAAAQSQSGATMSASAVAFSFATIAGGGAAIGLAIGLVAVGVAGRTDDHLVETALTVTAAFGSFLVAERLGVSGVLACVAAGLAMGNLGVLAGDDDHSSPFSARGRAFVLEFWEFAAFIANSLVFLMIGFAIAGIHYGDVGPMTLAFVVVAVLAGRALTVYPIGLAFAATRWAVPVRQQHLMWWGGLRGALSLALALSLPPALSGRDVILVSAFAVVAFSVVVQGLTAPLALKRLGLAAEDA